MLSGRRESNPVYIHPMDAYYRHTPARCYSHYTAFMIESLVYGGPIAQLVERVIRIDEVRSSTLLWSTGRATNNKGP